MSDELGRWHTAAARLDRGASQADVIEALRMLVKSCGHDLLCAFSGCTCGATARQAAALGEANRLIREMAR